MADNPYIKTGSITQKGFGFVRDDLRPLRNTAMLHSGWGEKFGFGDMELITKVKQGDKDSHEKLIRKYFRLILNLAKEFPNVDAALARCSRG